MPLHPGIEHKTAREPQGVQLAASSWSAGSVEHCLAGSSSSSSSSSSRLKAVLPVLDQKVERCSASSTEACAHLDEGGHAVGRAGGVGDDGVAVLVLLSVDADHVGGDVAALGRGGDDHLARACLQVLARTLAAQHRIVRTGQGLQNSGASC